LKLTPEQTLAAAINSLVSESQVQLRSKANGHYEIPWLNNYIFKEEYHKKKVEALRSLIANDELGTWVHNNEPEVAEVCSRIREILGKETNQVLLPPHVEYSQIHVSKDSTIHSGNHRSRSVFNQYQNSPSFCDQTHIKDRATIASAQLSDKRVIVKVQEMGSERRVACADLKEILETVKSNDQVMYMKTLKNSNRADLPTTLPNSWVLIGRVSIKTTNRPQV
jgi:hypothetical protein